MDDRGIISTISEGRADSAIDCNVRGRDLVKALAIGSRDSMAGPSRKDVGTCRGAYNHAPPHLFTLPLMLV